MGDDFGAFSMRLTCESCESLNYVTRDSQRTVKSDPRQDDDDDVPGPDLCHHHRNDLLGASSPSSTCSTGSKRSRYTALDEGRMQQFIAPLVRGWTLANDSKVCSLAADGNANTMPQVPIPAHVWSLLSSSWGSMRSAMREPSISTAWNSTPIHPISTSLIGKSLTILAVVMLLVLLRLLLQRHRARTQLQQCGLPVVYWRPKSLFGGSYDAPAASHTAMSSLLRPSNITNILPRMERLKGPYGMYGTVYGISTAVVHVAHPVPAAAILSSTTMGTALVESKQPTNGTRRPLSRASGVATSSGATKSPAYDHFKNFCGNGVFTADGDDWKQKRAAVLHVLMRSTAAATGAGGGGAPPATFEANVERNAHDAAMRLITHLERCIDQEERFHSSLPKMYKVNVVPLLQRATLGLIYRYLTHQDLPTDAELRKASFGNGDDDVIESGNGSIVCGDSGQKSHGVLSRYLDSITRIRMIVLAQSRSVWFLLPRWHYRTFSRMYRDEERTMGPIRSFSERACREAMPGSPLRILSRHFAPYCHADGSPAENKKPSSQEESTIPVSKHLLDEAITLLFAGQDTSAATLSWTLHLLSLHPPIQNKLAAEIATALPLEDNIAYSVPLTRKGLMQLPYLDAVVKESMRLYPVAPFVVRRLPCDVPVREANPIDGTSQQSSLRLPKDSFACIWIYALHRNKAFWKCPNEFRPERWLTENGPDRDAGISNGAYMPFATGPRSCVGQPMATIILRSLLARLIHQFTFEDPRLIGQEATPAIADALRKDMQAGFTVLPEGGVDLCIARRSHVGA
jgi:Cytochrome P450